MLEPRAVSRLADLVNVHYLPVGPEHIRVALYDVLGREVAVVFEGELLVGSHTHSVALSGLAPGAYLLRVDGAVSSLWQLITVFR